MSQSPQTRPSLVARLANSGDADAWEEFLSLYQPLILRLAARYGLQDSDARDVCQEVHAAVADDVDGFQPDGKPASFRRWLFTIARHRICKFLGKQRRLKLLTGGSDLHQQLNQVPDVALENDVELETEYRRQLLVQVGRRIRREFKPKTWRVFWKVAILEIPPELVAQELKMKIGAVYASKCRVICRLKEELNRLEGKLE